MKETLSIRTKMKRAAELKKAAKLKQKSYVECPYCGQSI